MISALIPVYQNGVSTNMGFRPRRVSLHSFWTYFPIGGKSLVDILSHLQTPERLNDVTVFSVKARPGSVTMEVATKT